MYDKMAEEEIGHRDMLLDLHRKKFGEFLPLIRRQDVKGFVTRRPIWLNRPLGARRRAQVRRGDGIRDRALLSPRRAYAPTTTPRAICCATLAAAEDKHEQLAHELGKEITPSERAAEDETAKRMFVLQYVQPGLAGLMDGSVSTLAPLFAAAFATHNTWSTFLVGLAAAVGAGISMAFAEAMSDDGSLTGRGAPVVRGRCRGAMTALGGLGHALPYLIPHFYIATSVAFAVVAVELVADLLDPHALHGHAVPAGGVPGGGRRRAGVRRRDTDRQVREPRAPPPLIAVNGLIRSSIMRDVRSRPFVRPAPGVAAAACRARRASAGSASSTGSASANSSIAPRCSMRSPAM